MSLLTTTIGAYPKPEYVSLPDRFRQGSAVARGLTGGDEDFLCPQPGETQELLDRATREAVREQVSMGIDIPTDGEIRREHYIYYHCRHLQGIDFSTLTHKIMRSGSWKAAVPTIVGPIQAINRFLQEDWRVAQSATNRPVKITIPGPMTIADSVADVYYGNEQTLGRALAEALNSEIRALADAGCRWIQVDEPVFVREPERALSYGIGNLERCFHGVPKGVKRIVHLCCGYPDRVDNDDYPKADPTVYPRLATPLDEAQIDALSIEDAYRHNHLTLLEKFKKSTVILGVIAIARSRVESVEEISRRIQEALRHIDPTRLMLAPDCGLGMLNRETVREKIKSMVKATRLVT
jgi:5-methyltetrahydropteroyltriglutamate--homocysteine methyltransferase